jgi:hypothetical protein
MNTPEELKADIRMELETARADFHSLLASLTEEDAARQSLNPGWTNGEILTHVAFGFIVVSVLLPMARAWGWFPAWTSKPFAWLLNALTVPFNWVNGLGARAQAKVFHFKRVGQVFDSTLDRLLKQLNTIRAEEWGRGMHYPTRWDDNFEDFMTLEQVLRYPLTHFRFHLDQIARGE